MVGKKHASGEISAKLAQASELAAKGKNSAGDFEGSWRQYHDLSPLEEAD